MFRKATGVPYISHLFSVTALVAEHGGDEDQMIAAMLQNPQVQAMIAQMMGGNAGTDGDTGMD